MAVGSPAPDAGSAFDGTWRPDYEPPGPEATPDVLSLAGGIYECVSCRPPYRVAADGAEHVVEGHPRFETIAVDVVDDRTVHLVGRRGGVLSFESTTIIDADGESSSETRTAATMVGSHLMPAMANRGEGEPEPVLFRIVAARIGPPIAGAHLASGSWRVVSVDLLNHDEDTTYRITDGSLTMSDRMGRSFTAPLDGTVAAYLGDSRFTRVAVRLLDERTIEESNFSGDTLVQVTRWQVAEDGTTMHVRFDDTRGHVMEQTGHKLP